MDVIEDRTRPAREIAGSVEKNKSLNVAATFLIAGKVLLFILHLVVCLSFTSGAASAAPLKAPYKSVAQITIDDEGHALRFPASVFFDPVEEELYVSNGGLSRVVVYGPDFFPRISIARGRGVLTPRGGLVMSNGEVYICQPRNINNPRARITVLNAAFFVDREIFLDEIPEAADFTPNHVAVSSDGIIYLSGTSSRGVLVLDNEGNFLRRLQPKDKISYREEAKEADEQEQQSEEEAALLANIPEEFRPSKGRQEGGSLFSEGLGPVKINFVTIDRAGRLYLMSDETSKIYVHGPDEAFLFTIGEKGGTPRHLSTPKSMAIDEKRGLIYVVDYMRQCILTYDMAGEFLFEFGGRGYGPGWFNYPLGLAINNHGQLFVADLFNNRVQVLEVSYEQFSPKLENASPAESSPAVSEAAEATGPDERVPEQPEDIDDQEKESEIGVVIKQEEHLSGQPEEASDQLKTPAQPMEQAEPDGPESEKPDTSE